MYFMSVLFKCFNVPLFFSLIVTEITLDWAFESYQDFYLHLNLGTLNLATLCRILSKDNWHPRLSQNITCPAAQSKGWINQQS